MCIMLCACLMQVFRNLFKDGLAIQKNRIQDVRRYAIEEREIKAKKRKNALDSLENLYPLFSLTLLCGICGCAGNQCSSVCVTVFTAAHVVVCMCMLLYCYCINPCRGV